MQLQRTQGSQSSTRSLTQRARADRRANRKASASIRNANNNKIHGKMSIGQTAVMRKYFWSQGPHGVLPMWLALEKVMMPTLDSLAYRGYIELRPRLGGFQCTEFGWEIQARWDADPVEKQHSSKTFGAYLRGENPQLNRLFDILTEDKRKGPTLVVIGKVKAKAAAA